MALDDRIGPICDLLMGAAYADKEFKDREREEVREMLVAALGCNVAWGIIDGVLYLSGKLFERARKVRLGERIRSAESDVAAAPIVAPVGSPSTRNGTSVQVSRSADRYRWVWPSSSADDARVTTHTSSSASTTTSSAKPSPRSHRCCPGPT